MKVTPNMVSARVVKMSRLSSLSATGKVMRSQGGKAHLNNGKKRSRKRNLRGTTVTDKNLWNAARSAALKAHFNQSASAPPVQIGTITYIFKLQ